MNEEALPPMTYLLLATVAVCTVVFPCALAFVCLPQNDGRGM